MIGAENGTQQLSSEIAAMQITETEMERDSIEFNERANFRMEEKDSVRYFVITNLLALYFI